MSHCEALLEEASELYESGNFQGIIKLLSLSAVCKHSHPHLFYYLAKAQQAQKLAPSLILKTCNEGLSRYQDFNPLRAIAFYSHLDAQHIEQAMQVGLVIFQANFIDLHLYFTLAQLLGEAERVEEANQVSRVANYQSMLTCFYRGDYNKALQYVQAVKRNDATFNAVRLFEVRIYIAQGRIAQAYDLAEQYHELADINYDILQLLVNLASRIGDKQATQSWAKAMLKAFPTDQHAKKQYYRVCQVEAQLTEKLLHVGTLRDDDELDFWLHLEASDLSHQLVNKLEFLNCAHDQQAQWHLINTLYDTGVKDHAINSLAKVLAESANMQPLLAFCNKLLSNFDHQLLLTLLEPLPILDWKEPELCAYYVQVLGRRSRDEAYQFADQAVQCVGQHHVIHWARLTVKFHHFIYETYAPLYTAEQESYLDIINEELTRHPDNASAYLYQGYLYSAQGEHMRAIASINKARDIGLARNLMPYSAYWLAYIHAELGLFEEALPFYEDRFITRVPHTNAIAGNKALHQRLVASIAAKERMAQSVPLWKRILFCLLLLLCNAMLYFFPEQDLIFTPLLTKLFATSCLVATILWIAVRVRYLWQLRQSNKLSQLSS